MPSRPTDFALYNAWLFILFEAEKDEARATSSSSFFIYLSDA